MAEAFDAPLENDAMADIAHLIEPVIPALRRYARTFVRDAADADDLVRTPWSERLAAGISGDPTATRVHGFSPSKGG